MRGEIIRTIFGATAWCSLLIAMFGCYPLVVKAEEIYKKIKFKKSNSFDKEKSAHRRQSVSAKTKSFL